MEYERKGVTVNLQIKNLKWFNKKDLDLYSPVFSVDEMEGTRWRLGLISKPFSLIIKREAEDNGPEKFRLDYDFLAPHGIQFVINRTYSCTFSKGLSRRMSALPDNDTIDSINFQCKMWQHRRSISKNFYFLIETPIRSEHNVIVREVENFSDLADGVKKTLEVISLPMDDSQIMVNLDLIINRVNRTPVENLLKIQINSLDPQTKGHFDVKFYVLDSSKNKSYFKEAGKSFLLHTATVEKQPLNATVLHLPNDTLSLHCEITSYYPDEHKISERTGSQTTTFFEGEEKDLSDVVKFLVLKQDIPCDTKLRTANETFPVHTAVLSAKSPVFEAMFRTDMKEAIQKCVRIEDVDAETVKRMLVFLYSGTQDFSETMFEESEWRDVMMLYVAANKYQILSLKEDCCEFLKQSIDLSNCIVLLHLAYMHEDTSLYALAKNYILKNTKNVLSCDQWLCLEKEIPQLAIGILREALKRKKHI